MLCVYRQVGTIHARRAATATNNGADSAALIEALGGELRDVG